MPINLPVNAQTLGRSLLEGRGVLELLTGQDNWGSQLLAGSPFNRQMAQGAGVRLAPPQDAVLKLGLADGLIFEVTAASSAGHRVELFWPGGGNEPLRERSLDRHLQPGKLCLHLVLDAEGRASARGSYPVGPLSTTFGVAAGGRASIERFCLYDDSRPGLELLHELFAGLRLPRQVDGPDAIPLPGEVLLTRFGGYLELSTGLSWGYSLAASRDIRVEKLSLEALYGMKLAAGLTASFRMAGEFETAARAGSAAGWARFTVRKSRDAVLPLAADFGFTGSFELGGWPDAFEQLLARLLGLDAQRVLGLFDKSLEYATPGELEKKAGALLMGAFDRLSRRWLGAALSGQNLAAFLARMREAAGLWGTLDTRAAGLFEDYLPTLDTLRADLRAVSAAGSRDGLRKLAGGSAWDLVRRLYGDRLPELLLDDEAFSELTGFSATALDFLDGGQTADVRDFLTVLRQEIPLDGLIEELARLDSPEKLREASRARLQDLAGRLLGTAFNQLDNSGLPGFFRQLNTTLQALAGFRDTLYTRLKEATRQSIAASLHYGFTHATFEDALVDVELDLHQPEGCRLAARAADGDWSGILAAPEHPAVRLLGGVFVRSVRDTAQVRINLLGWTWQGLTELVRNSEHSIEQHAGALLHLYTTTAWIRQRRESGRKWKEVVQSKFLFRVLGATLERDGAEGMPPGGPLVESLRAMGVEYELLHEDDRTDPAELSQYLELARFLGLIPDPALVASQLAREFPHGLGRVRAAYVARYDAQAVRGAFELSGEALDRVARATMRQYIATRYTSMKSTHHAAALGFLYLSGKLHEIYDKQGWTALRDTRERFLVPAWFTGGAEEWREIPPALRQTAVTLFNVESSYRDRLRRLHQLVTAVAAGRRRVPWKELEKASRDFVEMAGALDQFRENAFFAVFDQLCRAAGRGKARRDSALILEITPPGGEKVTKIWMPA